MSYPQKERRNSPRQDDPVIGFRWIGARRNEPVANFSLSGAKLLTTRSAPVGALLEFELHHIDGSSLKLRGTVRRVERLSRRSGGDGTLSLSVEFRQVDEQQQSMMERWRDSSELAAGGTAAGATSEGKVEPTKHEGRLWEGSDSRPGRATRQVPRADYPETSSGVRRAVKVDAEVADLFESPQRAAQPAGRPAAPPAMQPAPSEADEPELAERSGMAADQEELIAQLQHRLARAEEVAAEALTKLAGAQDRLEHLGVYEDPPIVETPSEVDPLSLDRTEAEPTLRPLAGGGAPLMVDALLDTDEHEAIGGPLELAEVEPAEEDLTLPISAAVKNLEGVSFSSAPNEPAALAECLGPGDGDGQEGADLDDDAESDDGPESRGFSQERLAAAQAASDASLSGVSLGLDDEGEGEDSASVDAQAGTANLDEELESTADGGALATSRQEMGNGGGQAKEDVDGEGQKSTPGGFVKAIPATADVSLDLSQRLGTTPSDTTRTPTNEPSWPELELEPADGIAVPDQAVTRVVAQDGTEDLEVVDDGTEDLVVVDDGTEDLVVVDDGTEDLVVVDDGTEDQEVVDDDTDDPDTSGWFPNEAVKALAAEIGAEEIAADECFGEGRDRSAEAEEPGADGPRAGEFGTDEPSADESDDAVAEAFASPVSASQALTFREVPSREGMLEAMGRGSIVRTERFRRLEPVSRADIQVSDLLLETDDIRELEKRAAGMVERDQLYKVLYVFFQRGLVEIEVGARG